MHAHPPTHTHTYARQGKLKQIRPDDRIYIGIESDGPLKLSGFLIKAAARIVTKLIERTVAHAHCTMGDDREVCVYIRVCVWCGGVWGGGAGGGGGGRKKKKKKGGGGLGGGGARGHVR